MWESWLNSVNQKFNEAYHIVCRCGDVSSHAIKADQTFFIFVGLDEAESESAAAMGSHRQICRCALQRVLLEEFALGFDSFQLCHDRVPFDPFRTLIEKLPVCSCTVLVLNLGHVPSRLQGYLFDQVNLNRFLLYSQRQLCFLRILMSNDCHCEL